MLPNLCVQALRDVHPSPENTRLYPEWHVFQFVALMFLTQFRVGTKDHTTREKTNSSTTRLEKQHTQTEEQLAQATIN